MADPEITYAGQIVAEAPEIQAYKIGLLEAAKNQIAQPITLPAYQSAGLSDLQKTATGVGQAYADLGKGVGAYSPFMQSGADLLGTAGQAYQSAAQGIMGLNTAPGYDLAQQGMLAGATTAAGISPYVELMGAGYANIGQGSETLQGAQQAAMQAGTTAQGISPFAQVAGTGYENIAAGTERLQQGAGAMEQAGQIASGISPYAQLMGAGYQNIAQGGETLGQAATGMQGAGAIAGGISPYAQIAGLGYENIGQGTEALGIGSQLAVGAANMFDPTQTQGFMNPYQQQVIDEAIKQIDRQGQIAQQGLSAQAVRSGAFGGTREGVQRAELGRNLADMKNQAIIGGLQSGYQSAQQQAQAAFEAQQARQAQAAQSLAGIGGQLTQQGLATGQLAGQQAGMLGQEAALQAQINQALAGIGQAQSQQGLLGAQLAGQQAGLLGQEAALQAQIGQGLAGIGGQLTQQGLATGQLAGQQAGIFGQQGALESQIAQQLAGIGQAQTQQGLAGAQIANQQVGALGNIAQLQSQIGQGIGGLTGQQAQTELSKMQGISQIGQGIGSLAAQQGQMAGQAQALAQGDINTYLALGGLQSQAAQQLLDANRATQLQQTMMPYQQLGFLSDIYKGAPSTSSTLTGMSAPGTSPLAQAIGMGTSLIGAFGAANKAGGP